VDGSINKYNMRLVARGFTQIYRVNYYDTYSPVIWLISFCLILAIAICNNWDIKVFNFNLAYLNESWARVRRFTCRNHLDTSQAEWHQSSSW